MEDLFKNRFAISSSRLASWDYGSNGAYFITICTKDRNPYFGEIEECGRHEMALAPDAGNIHGTRSVTETRSIAFLRKTEIGGVAENNWYNIPSFHPYVELDEFVLMPDHLHGILFIDKPDETNWEINKFGSQSKNIASILRGYKSSVTTYATTNNIEFLWQPRFYDRVIRTEKEYLNIKGYIKENPDNWFLDEDNFENLFL